MGDPTPDGKVDFNDLMVFATAYGSETGDSNWNELCDICGYLGDPTPDGKINFEDLMLFAMNYGKELEDYYYASMQVFDLSEQKLNEIMEEPPADVETCLTILGDYLVEQPNVESYEVMEDTLKVIFDSGSYSTITLIDLDTTNPKLTGGLATIQEDSEISKINNRENYFLIPIQKKTTGENIDIFKSNYREKNSIKSNKTKKNTNFEYIGVRSAIIWDPFHTYFAQLGYDTANEYSQILNNLGQDFYIKVYEDHEADIEALKTIQDFGIVIFDTHGADGYQMVTGEVPDSTNSEKYSEELNADDQEIYISEHLGVSINNKKVERYEDRYGVTAYWFNYKHLPVDFPNSIIINNSCESTKYGFLWGTFLLSGAATYYGHSEDSHIVFGMEMVKNVLQNLVDGKTTGEAYEEYSEIYWEWWLPHQVTNTWEMYGKENVKIPIEETGSVYNQTQELYYATIQAALDDADNGDTIEVSDGTYDESIFFPPGKAIVLQSLNGSSSTIIRGDDGSNTVTLNNSPEGTTLEGFTITHTDGLTGSGIYITNSNVKINNCNISGNYSNTVCVGIYNDGDLTITESNISGNSNNSSNEDDWCFGISNSGVLNINKCTISGNFSNNWCFAIYNSYGNLSISESSIFNNFATNFLCCGIFINSGDLTITGSNIYGNSGAYGGGIYFDFPTSGVLPIGGEIEGEKNTICGNFSIGNNPSLDQQIADAVGSLYDTYKDINYISAYCE